MTFLRAGSSLHSRSCQVLAQLAAGISVGGKAQLSSGIDDVKAAKGHAIAQLGAGLAEGEGLA